MTTAAGKPKAKFHIPVMEGLLPIERSQVPAEVIASVGSDQYVALAAVLAFMAAGFLILARIIGLGFLADFLSRTVLVGFLTGVGIQVAFGEISGMLGLKGGGHGTLGKIWTDIQQIEQVNYYALVIALAVLVVLTGSKKISNKIPGG